MWTVLVRLGRLLERVNVTMRLVMLVRVRVLQLMTRTFCRKDRMSRFEERVVELFAGSMRPEFV